MQKDITPDNYSSHEPRLVSESKGKMATVARWNVGVALLVVYATLLGTARSGMGPDDGSGSDSGEQICLS